MSEEDNGVSPFIRAILERADCSNLVDRFKGIPEAKFAEFTYEQIIDQLPANDESSQLVAVRILMALGPKACLASIRKRNSVVVRSGSSSNAAGHHAEGESHGNENGADSSGSSSDDESERSLNIPTSSRGQSGTSIEVITLDSDEDEESGHESPNDTDTEGDGFLTDSDSETSSSSDDEIEAPKSKKQRRQIQLSDLVRKASKNEDLPDSSEEAAVGSKRDINSRHKCHSGRVGTKVSDWSEFFKKHGPNILKLDVYKWCWKPLSSRCPYNLNKILEKCEKLKKLTLLRGVDQKDIDSDLPFGERSKRLPCLRRITIRHPGKVQYKKQLKSILRAASQLKTFEYQYHDRKDANEILDMLLARNCDRLKRIEFNSFNFMSLSKTEMEKLMRIQAPKLKFLDIGHGFRQNVSGKIIEDLLKHFPMLQVLRLNGNFEAEPGRGGKTEIEVPQLKKLWYLNIGGGYKFAKLKQKSLLAN